MPAGPVCSELQGLVGTEGVVVRSTRCLGASTHSSALLSLTRGMCRTCILKDGQLIEGTATSCTVASAPR